MASIVQGPAQLTLTGVAGDPFTLTLDVTVTDANGNTIPWSSVTNATAEVVKGTRVVSTMAPTLTSPSSGVWQLAWTAAQTTTMSQTGALAWNLSATISGTGPLALVAGSIVFNPATQPNTSTAAVANLAVSVGTASATVTVTVTGTVTLTPASLDVTRNLVTRTANYTAADGDVVLANGTFTVTVPIGAGQQVTVKNTGSGTVTLVPASGTLDGAANLTIPTKYESITTVGDGTNAWAV